MQLAIDKHDVRAEYAALLSRDAYETLRCFSNDVQSDKSHNTLGDWVRDYGGRTNEKTYIEFGSYEAIHAMLVRRDKEIVREVLDALFGAQPV